MTIASETNRSGPYSCNGSTTVFPFGFKVYDEAHLRVVLTDAAGADTTLSLGSGYTVDDVGVDAGGSITTGTAYAAGNKITILLNVPFTQDTDLENQGAFYAEVIERALDLAAQRSLQLDERITRAFVAPANYPSGAEIAPEDLVDISQNLTAIRAIKVDAEVAAAAAEASELMASGFADASASSAADAAASAEDVALFGGAAWTLIQFTATAGQTVFPLGQTIDPAVADVLHQGATYPHGGDDYILTATTLTLAAPAELDDKVEVKLFKSFAVGNALVPSNNLSDVVNKASARSNLDLGTASVENAGTAANQLLKIDSDGHYPALSGEKITGLVFTKDSGWLPEVAIVAGGTFSVSHGLGVMPKVVLPFLRCKTTELGYLVGDMVPINPSYVYDGASSGIGLTPRLSTIAGVVGNGGNIIPILNITTGVKSTITPANWRIVLRAFA